MYGLWKKHIDTLEPFNGCVFDKIEGAEDGSDEIKFYESGHERFRMYHSQDCCESVSVEDICGDICDLIGSPIIEAEIVENDEGPKVNTYTSSDGRTHSYTDESGTWTFYKLGTIKGHVTIRWYGSSNGYYSESVDIADMNKED